MRLLRLLVISAIAVPAFGLTGRVLDSTGAALPGVTIVATSAGRAFVVTTERSGRYSLDLVAGTYDVAFSLANFATVSMSGVDANATKDVTLALTSGAEVVVAADEEKDLLGVATSASEGVVTEKRIESRPYQRAGEILETVPGVVISQHSGEGKANQYYLRGFNLDHGTDIAISVAGVPVNMPTHAHGQGYADTNFVIPELLSDVQYRKGPYFAEEGDFASAGAVSIDYRSMLEKPVTLLERGMFGYDRALAAASSEAGEGVLLFAFEAARNRGPWKTPDDYRRLNGVLRYSTKTFSVTGMAYDGRWNATDQIPERSVAAGALSRYGAVDPTDGGSSSRYSLAASWQRDEEGHHTQITAYGLRYRLDLFSNFTYFLDDPVHGDQFEQSDDRLVMGMSAAHRWAAMGSENSVGVQVREDDIHRVGLFHTVARQRLGTERNDSIRELTAGVFAQSATQWRSHLRTTIGIRADHNVTSIVNPKLSVIAGPWRQTEVYLNAGGGFHSNDARSPDRTLVRTRGEEIGVRTTPLPRLHVTATLWRLGIASELVFAGDSGTTQPSLASRRTGVELWSSCDLAKHLVLDAEYARSHARFVNGDHIPGAVEGVATAGLALADAGRFSGELRYRYFGPRPLIEDNSVRSSSSHLVSARTGYSLGRGVQLNIDVFNLLNAKASDVDYFYVSRLRNEPAGGVPDVHFHPVEKRAIRAGVRWEL